MAKRFTDSNKWRKPWFRKLSIKAKLLWIYLCDECDHSGVIDLDFELISFQVGFRIEESDLFEYFGDKVEKIGTSKFFLLPFYNFQYSSAKDTWTAKVKARDAITALGYEIKNDEVLSKNNVSDEKYPQSPHSGGPENSVLIVDVGVGVGVVEDVGVGVVVVEDKESDFKIFVEYWNTLPFGLTKVSKLTDERKRKLRARLKEATLDEWKQAMERIGQSSFLRGNVVKWKADFDWLISNEENRLKIIEGKYDNSTATVVDFKKTKAQQTESNLANLWAQVEAEEREVGND